MKNLTDQEIKDGVAAVLKVIPTFDETRDDFEVSVERNEKGHILFEATKMYDWDLVKMNEGILEAFRVWFGADNVEHYEDITIGGCETCDYWSQYGYAIRLWDNK